MNGGQDSKVKLGKVGKALIALGGVILILRIIFPVGYDDSDRILAFNPFDSSAGYEADYAMTVLHIIALVLVAGLILFLRFSFPNLFTFRTFKRACLWVGIPTVGAVTIIAAYLIVSYLLEQRRIRTELIDTVYTARTLLPERYREVIQLTDAFFDTLSAEDIVTVRSRLYGFRDFLQGYDTPIDLAVLPLGEDRPSISDLKRSLILLLSWEIELQHLYPYTRLMTDKNLSDSLSMLTALREECKAILDTLCRLDPSSRGQDEYTAKGRIVDLTESLFVPKSAIPLADRFSARAHRISSIREYLIAEIGLVESPPDHP